MLKSLVFSLRTTVRGTRDSLREADQTFSVRLRIIGSVSDNGTSCSKVSSAEIDLGGLFGTTWRFCSRIALATRVAVGRPVLFSVTSRYASSSDSGSTRSVCRLKISRARRETVRYRVKSGGTKTASGHKRSARTAGMAERTPKRLASYEAAHTTERLPRHATMTGLPRSCESSRCSTEA